MAVDARLYIRFEEFCARVLEHMGFRAERNVLLRADGHIREIDIVATEPYGESRLIEVKWGASSSVSLQQIRDWSAKTATFRFGEYKLTPLLIVAGRVDKSRRDWAEHEYKIEIWDRDFLVEQASSAHFANELDAFFRETDEVTRIRRDKPALPASDFNEQLLAEELSEVVTKGDELIALLDSIPPGKKGAKQYEQACQDIIGYLFGDHLLDPRPQSRLEDNLSYLDIVYRVSPLHPFWETLTRDFRARVVVFECKNYSGQIGPLQVYTTERYMSVGALRPICFLLSRQAVHQHAELAAFGAMRESGKLLIFLSDDDLKAMLRVRDAQLREGSNYSSWAQNDPTILLDQKIYDFVSRLPR